MKQAPKLFSKLIAFTIILCQVLSLVFLNFDNAIAQEINTAPQFNPPILTHSTLIAHQRNIFQVQSDPIYANIEVTSWWLTVTSLDGEYVNQVYKTDIAPAAPTEIAWIPSRDKVVDGWWTTEEFPPGEYKIDFQMTYSYVNWWFNIRGINDIQTVHFSEIAPLYSSVEDVPPLPTPTPSPTPTPTYSPTPTLVPTPEVTPTPTPTPNPNNGEVRSEVDSKLHPVLFIHGLNSYPYMWYEEGSDYFSLLKSWGYPKEYIASYAYTGVGVGLNGYNNQGHIFDAALGMDEAVDTLSRRSIENGGDGKVDIVAHSMGGLIARQYLKTHQDNHNISKIIAIATPFQGSEWLSIYSSLGTYGQLAYNETISRIIRLAISANPNNPGPREMIPGSSLLTNLAASNFDPEIDYTLIYGSYNGRVMREIFNMNLISDSQSLGDLVVMDESASMVANNQPAVRYKFEEKDPLWVQSYIEKERTGYSQKLKLHTLELFRYNHFEIYKQPEIKSLVIKELLNH